MFNRRQFISSAALASGVLPAALHAQSTQVARICNGFPAGSSADTVSRLVANKLTTNGMPFIVENRAGAGGRLAVDNIRTSAPDGQSVLITPDAMMILYPHVYKNLTYDPVRDFRPVITLATVPIGLAVGPQVPATVHTLADFAQWCKANPQLASFGTSGAGTTLHFIGVMFARASGIELTHAAYRGANLAAQDVAGGQIAACVAVLSDVLPLVQAGKLRLLGVTSPARSRFVPDVPTFREAGFRELEGLTWYGMFVPARTPDAKVQALQAATAEVLRQPDIAEGLGKFALEPAPGSSQQLGDALKADLARWAGVVKQVGYTATE